MPNYYEILGIENNATKAQIKQAYYRLSREHHPDKHSNASDAVKAEHAEKFVQVNEANEVLSDPVRRAAYDRSQANHESNAEFQAQQAAAANEARHEEARQEQQAERQGAQQQRTEPQEARHQRAEPQEARHQRAEYQGAEEPQRTRYQSAHQYKPTTRFFVQVQPQQQPSLSSQDALKLIFLLHKIQSEQIAARVVMYLVMQNLVQLLNNPSSRLAMDNSSSQNIAPSYRR